MAKECAICRREIGRFTGVVYFRDGVVCTKCYSKAGCSTWNSGEMASMGSVTIDRWKAEKGFAMDMQEKNKKLSFRDDVLPMAAKIAAVIVVFALFIWGFYRINNKSLFTTGVSAVRGTIDSKYYGDGICCYPECNQAATTEVKSDTIYPSAGDVYKKALEMVLKVPNEAQFQMCSDSFSYVDKKEHTKYEKNTYLIPNGDGSIRLETRTDKFVFYTSNGRKTMNYVYFEGHYCDEHAETARTTRYNEIQDIFFNKNPGYTYYANGFFLTLLLFPVSIGVSFIVFGIMKIYYLVEAKKKETNT